MTNRLPAETFPPGEFLRDELEARGWSQIDLAEILGRPPRLISELIAGKRAITPKTAKGLSEALGTSAQYWMNLESAYQLSRASVPDNTVARKAKLYADYPIREMVKRSWIEPSPSIEVLEQQVHRFFGSPSSGMATIGHAATYEPVETQGETAGITDEIGPDSAPDTTSPNDTREGQVQRASPSAPSSSAGITEAEKVERAKQELATQAQELDMGYGPSVPEMEFINTACLRDEPQPAPSLSAREKALLEAATEYRDRVNNAGLLNLSNGVQLGPTYWYVKMSDLDKCLAKALSAYAGEAV